MSISLQVEPSDGYLSVRVTGTFELEAAEAETLRVLQASVEHKLASVLLDIRLLLGAPTILERYEYAEFLVREVRASVVRHGGPTPRLAYLGLPPLIDPERFGVLVARNRGLPVLVTEDLDEALGWLGVTRAQK